jgi:hypothetical protein
MRKANVAQLVIGLTLLAAPAFASTDATANFRALGEISTDLSAPAMLSDEQLATVEGGDHLTTGFAHVLYAYVLANQQPTVFGPGNRSLLRAMATASLATGVFIMQSMPIHNCGPGTC